MAIRRHAERAPRRALPRRGRRALVWALVLGIIATGAVLLVRGSGAALPASSHAATGLYGTGINADSKANLQVGWTNGARLDHRFRATTTSPLVSVRFAQRGGRVYSGGSGGAMRISLQSDAAGKPSGAILSSVDYVPGNPAGDWEHFDSVAFPSPPTVTAGKLYHLVFENTDTEPVANWISVNELYVFGDTLVPRQPAFDDDYAVLYASPTTWVVQAGYTAIMDLAFADGTHDGMGYIEAMNYRYGTVSGGMSMVREQFTVSGGSRTVAAVSVRVRRTYGPSPLVLTLETADGSVLDSATASPDLVPASAPGVANAGAVWVTATFSAIQTLRDGASYDLRLSTAPDTEYTTTPIREGTDAVSKDPVVGLRSYRFTDGRGQSTMDGGSTWADLYLWSPVDLQFYLE